MSSPYPTMGNPPAQKKQKINECPPWDTNHKFKGRLFCEEYGKGVLLYREITGYLSDEAVVLSGPLAGTPVYKDSTGNPVEMFHVAEITGVKNDYDELCKSYELEPHELPGTVGNRQWVDGINHECQQLPLSSSITNPCYSYNDGNAVITQQNLLATNSQINEFTQIVAIHSQDYTDMRYLPRDGGVFEFICDSEWGLLVKTFPAFSAFEKNIVNTYKNDLFTWPLSDLQCNLLPNEIMGDNHSLVMISLSNIGRRSTAEKSIANAFNTVIKTSFHEQNGIEPLYGSPNVILFAITESAAPTSANLGNIIGFVIFEHPSSVNEKGQLQLIAKSDDDVNQYSHQPTIIEWLHVQLSHRNKGVATFLQQLVGSFGRFLGHPIPYTLRKASRASEQFSRLHGCCT